MVAQAASIFFKTLFERIAFGVSVWTKRRAVARE